MIEKHLDKLIEVKIACILNSLNDFNRNRKLNSCVIKDHVRAWWKCQPWDVDCRPSATEVFYWSTSTTELFYWSTSTRLSFSWSTSTMKSSVWLTSTFIIDHWAFLSQYWTSDVDGRRRSTLSTSIWTDVSSCPHVHALACSYFALLIITVNY